MRFLKSAALWYVAIFFFLLVVFAIFNVSVKDIEELKLAENLLYFRLFIYALVIGFWSGFVKLVVFFRALQRRRVRRGSLTDEKESDFIDKEKEYFSKKRWKVAIFFIAFEVLAVNRLWL